MIKVQPSPSVVAAQCLRAAGGDPIKATDMMVSRANRDMDLYRAILDPTLRQGCYSFVRGHLRTKRRVVWENAQPTIETDLKRVKALSVGIQSSLLNFALPGGKLLRQAKRDEIMEAAEEYSAKGENMSHKGRWLALVASRVPQGKTAGQVLTAKTLAKLQLDAAHD